LALENANSDAPLLPHILTKLPDGLLALPANRLHEVLPSHTLLHLDGKQTQPLFFSLLQHGNETTSWDALRRLLNRYSGQLPRRLVLYFGNLEAAGQGKRVLRGQPDFNRNWPGTDLPPHPIQPLLGDIAKYVRGLAPFAAVDFHNNSGSNPYYAAINSVDPKILGLASLFADIGVHFSYPRGVQAMALLSACPAITVECGRVQQTDFIAHTLEFMDRLLNSTDLPGAPAPRSFTLYDMAASLSVAEGIPVQCGNGPANGALVLRDDLDDLNFSLLPPGTLFGWCEHPRALIVRDREGRPTANLFLEFTDQTLTTTRPLMPAMLTLDPDVIRDDCLGYLMESMPFTGSTAIPG